jgi:hypothetical protein
MHDCRKHSHGIPRVFEFPVVNNLKYMIMITHQLKFEISVYQVNHYLHICMIVVNILMLFLVFLKKQTI